MFQHDNLHYASIESHLNQLRNNEMSDRHDSHIRTINIPSVILSMLLLYLIIIHTISME